MRNDKVLLSLIGLVLCTSGASVAQQVGTCERGSKQAFLDANSVRAAVYNGGNLFWRGTGNVYTVPKGGDANAIFVANLWIGGLVDGELRFAGTDYGPFEYFPGPLTDSGELPNAADCSAYDRIYEVTLRRVAIVVDTAMPAGWHEVVWDGSAHASGIYTFSIYTENRGRTRSMVLLR